METPIDELLDNLDYELSDFDRKRAAIEIRAMKNDIKRRDVLLEEAELIMASMNSLIE